MSILSRTRTRSSASPKGKGKGKAPLYPTTTNTSETKSTTEPRSTSTSLTFAGVANIFIKLRNLERQTKSPHTIVCESGETPISHPRVTQSRTTLDFKVPIVREDTFVCAGNGGVNVLQLLRATRSSLLAKAHDVGATALMDESWKCVIDEPKNRRGTYKIQIRYSASAIQSTSRDSLQPVAIDHIVGKPGLMTIIRRKDD